jgi:hypothetical protein
MSRIPSVPGRSGLGEEDVRLAVTESVARSGFPPRDTRALVGLGGVMAVRGEAGPGILAIAIGLVVSYGAYLFMRAAWRTRRALHAHPGTANQRNARRQRAWAIVGYGFLVAAGSVFAPVPVPVRVLSAVGALLVVPAVLAVEFEPPKRRPPKQAP